jgi:hypothetical protein
LSEASFWSVPGTRTGRVHRTSSEETEERGRGARVGLALGGGTTHKSITYTIFTESRLKMQILPKTAHLLAHTHTHTHTRAHAVSAWHISPNVASHAWSLSSLARRPSLRNLSRVSRVQARRFRLWSAQTDTETRTISRVWAPPGTISVIGHINYVFIYPARTHRGASELTYHRESCRAPLWHTLLPPLWP